MSNIYCIQQYYNIFRKLFLHQTCYSQCIMRGALYILLIALAVPATVDAARGDRLEDVESWGYQLQDIRIPRVANSEYDVVVIDYSADGTDDAAFTRKQIRRLQNEGKIVLAYLSIGEAEDYRFYWQEEWGEDPPSWLGPENSDWEGNYKVRYWYRGWWRQALRPYLNKIDRAGFDGVYLDIVDAYYYWGQNGYSTKRSANRMARLTKRIRRRLGSAAIVCPQNGESIIDDAGRKHRRMYWRQIDCIGVEDLFYHTLRADRRYRKRLLRRFANHGKTIINVEYIKRAKNRAYRRKVRRQNFPLIPFRAAPNRELNKL